jgi:hypothetical protein
MSIDVNVQNDLVIVTESSEDITVNVSNAAGPAGVGVPVGGTTGQVLKKFTNTDYDTYWAADASGLTSVGLSMPSAFAVSNSPLISNGTIAVTGAGTSAQYIRGDGQLANFPTNGGGGSSVNYYLNGSVTQGTFGGTTYYEMSKTPVLGAGTDFTRTNAQGDGYIALFITDAGDPSLLNIPGGNWNLEFYFQSSASGGSPQFYGEIYKVDASNNFTLVASGSTNPEGITNGTTVDQYFTSIPVPQTSLLVTDRLAIRIYVITSGRTITLHTEDGNLCEVLTTFSTGLNALNGLTAQVQYFATGTSGTDFAISSATDTHTFNLPTASATNRGALSSADWSTFSGKVGGSGTAGQVAYWSGTGTQTGSNNLFWDAANSRLGIGTNTPVASLDVNGSIKIVGGGKIYASNSSAYYIELQNGGSNTLNINGFSGIKFLTGSSSEGARLFSTNNLLLQNGGTFTDSGQRLQVQGDAFIRGSGATSATNALLVQNSAGTQLVRVYNNYQSGAYIGAEFGDGTFAGTNFFNNLNGSASIQTRFVEVNASDAILNINGGNGVGNTSLTQNRGAILIGNGNYALTGSTQNNVVVCVTGSFIPTSGSAGFVDLFVRPTINQTGGANGITRGLFVNPTLTAAADWRSIEWSNNSGWGLYGAGTANNYLAGKLVIGTTTVGTQTLQVNGDAFLKGSGATSGSNGLLIQNSSSSNIFNFRNDGTLLMSTVSGQTIPVINIVGRTSPINAATYIRVLRYGNSDSINQSAEIFGYWDDSNVTGFRFQNGLGTGGGVTFNFIPNGNVVTSNVVTVNQTFNPTSGTATIAQLLVSPTINQTGGANGITRGLYVNPTLTAAADWRSIEWSNNSGWGLYGAGTADNYLAGKLLINTTTVGTFNLDVNGTARVSGDFTIADTRNIILATGTGTKIGTATSQKLSFWNATPIVQPTTAVASATRVSNAGSAISTGDTFDGYTVAQVIKALRDTGILA